MTFVAVYKGRLVHGDVMDVDMAGKRGERPYQMCAQCVCVWCVAISLLL